MLLLFPRKTFMIIIEVPSKKPACMIGFMGLKRPLKSLMHASLETWRTCANRYPYLLCTRVGGVRRQKHESRHGQRLLSCEAGARSFSSGGSSYDSSRQQYIILAKTTSLSFFRSLWGGVSMRWIGETMDASSSMALCVRLLGVQNSNRFGVGTRKICAYAEEILEFLMDPFDVLILILE